MVQLTAPYLAAKRRCKYDAVRYAYKHGWAKRLVIVLQGRPFHTSAWKHSCLTATRTAAWSTIRTTLATVEHAKAVCKIVAVHPMRDTGCSNLRDNAQRRQRPSAVPTRSAPTSSQSSSSWAASPTHTGGADDWGPQWFACHRHTLAVQPVHDCGEPAALSRRPRRPVDQAYDNQDQGADQRRQHLMPKHSPYFGVPPSAAHWCSERQRPPYCKAVGFLADPSKQAGLRQGRAQVNHMQVQHQAEQRWAHINRLLVHLPVHLLPLALFCAAFLRLLCGCGPGRCASSVLRMRTDGPDLVPQASHSPISAWTYHVTS